MKLDLNMDVVRELALDIWDDLSRTRLAGVAVGLGLALLAIMALVLRPGGSPDILQASTHPPAAVVTPATEDEVAFTVPGEKPLKLADVDLSSPRDPFGGLAAAGGEQSLMPADESVQEAVDSVSGGGSGGSAASAGYGDTSSLMPLDDLSTTSDPAPPVPDTTSDGTLDADSEPREPASAPVTDYSYTADVQFGRVDDLKRYSSVQRLGLVPSRRLPLLMYLGTSTDHKTAVFMVDSRLSQGGEGRCVPKASLCTFLELRATPEQDEHRFRDADGNEYLLRLRGLVRTTAAGSSLNGRSVSELPGSPPVVDGAR